MREPSITEELRPDRLVTIVVPVYLVADYLRPCLDSILVQADARIEVVAVDDASPDGCGGILDEYAARDDRIRVVHLATNVGLGPARNAGLAHARGRYVWFVDSDDTLAAGALPAIADQLLTLDPDVLLLDHVRVSADGTERADAHSGLLAGIRGLVTLAERPELLGLQHTAWSRVIRRDLLTRTQITFRPGWYEDCAFTNPVLIAAETIAVLDRVCYRYRHARPGAITATPSRRHFEAFDQYAHAADLVDRHGDAAEIFRPHLFRTMIDHYLVIVGSDNRLPPASRREFFRTAARQYRQHRPADGYPMPHGVDALKHQLLRFQLYPLYALLRWTARRSARRPTGGYEPQVTSARAGRHDTIDTRPAPVTARSSSR